MRTGGLPLCLRRFLSTLRVARQRCEGYTVSVPCGFDSWLGDIQFVAIRHLIRLRARASGTPVINQSTYERCRQLVDRCDTDSGWSLEASVRERYATALAPLLVGLPEERWQKVAANYHADHELVAALLSAGHPGHDDAWTRWCAQVVGVLRRSGRAGPQDGALDVDDIAQVARAALVEALPSYRYHSRLSTWAYSVIERAARDYHRAARARRRSGPTVSLDGLADSAHPAEADATHEQLARSRLLAERIAAVLATHPDRRLAIIFFLSAAEERSSAEIGAIVRLHESRVRALLKLARDLLRADPAIQAWAERER